MSTYLTTLLLLGVLISLSQQGTGDEKLSSTETIRYVYDTLKPFGPVKFADMVEDMARTMYPYVSKVVKGEAGEFLIGSSDNTKIMEVFKDPENYPLIDGMYQKLGITEDIKNAKIREVDYEVRDLIRILPNPVKPLDNFTLEEAIKFQLYRWIKPNVFQAFDEFLKKNNVVWYEPKPDDSSSEEENDEL